MLRLATIVILPILGFAIYFYITPPIPKVVQVSPQYFPTQVGTTWVYQDGDKERKIVVVKVERKGESYIITSAMEKEGKLIPCAEEKLSAEGLFVLTVRSGDDMHTFDPPQCIFKLPVEPGTQWTEERVAGIVPTHKIGSPERVSVPAGTFMAVPIVTETKSAPGIHYISRISTGWYVPGIGCIKAESSDGTTVLKSFTLGKD
jgi:hypothetical protein